MKTSAGPLSIIASTSAVVASPADEALGEDALKHLPKAMSSPTGAEMCESGEFQTHWAVGSRKPERSPQGVTADRTVEYGAEK